MPVCSDQYQCTYGQKCKITLKSRKQCQYCRFHKCLEIGMKPTWVMTDEEKKEKREKTIKRKQLPPTLPKDKVQVQLKIILRNIFLSFRSPCTFCFINLMHVSSKNWSKMELITFFGSFHIILKFQILLWFIFSTKKFWY